MKRTLFNIVLLGVIFYAPWWFACIVAAFGIFYITSYYEIIFAGALIDIFYGIPGGVYVGYGMLGLAGGLVSFLVFERIKRELR
ncbi:MAG: hypothetical protein ACYCZ7_01700 [Minisyncoccota bacterium]